jgi:hypothetical protein
MLRILLSSLTRLAIPYFSTLSHKWYDLQKPLGKAMNQLDAVVVRLTAVQYTQLAAQLHPTSGGNTSAGQYML